MLIAAVISDWHETTVHGAAFLWSPGTAHQSKKRFWDDGRRNVGAGVVGLFTSTAKPFSVLLSLEAVVHTTTSWRPQPPLAVTSKRRLRCNRPPNAAASSPQALYASLLELLQVHRHLCRRQHHCHRCSCPQQRQCARRVLAAAPCARVPSDRLPLACAALLA